MKIYNNEPNADAIVRMAHGLIGSMTEITDAIKDTFGERYELSDVDHELLNMFDEVTEMCDCCGWWVEGGTLNDTGECEDCADDQEDYE